MGLHADRQAHPGDRQDDAPRGDDPEQGPDALPSHCDLLRLKSHSTFSSARLSGSFSLCSQKLTRLGGESPDR